MGIGPLLRAAGLLTAIMMTRGPAPLPRNKISSLGLNHGVAILALTSRQ